MRANFTHVTVSGLLCDSMRPQKWRILAHVHDSQPYLLRFLTLRALSTNTGLQQLLYKYYTMVDANRERTAKRWKMYRHKMYRHQLMYRHWSIALGMHWWSSPEIDVYRCTHLHINNISIDPPQYNIWPKRTSTATATLQSYNHVRESQ